LANHRLHNISAFESAA